ncbi:hypothetical protein SM11_chr1104 [Sinorhizobium meliloti SM11]|uniref:Uncharacterized protein n=1 Tax=Sinorhizobium meliloti (strain SM11) TaxID=707241 RepID=F7X3H7_SINMM|nr:hypothetical protein SM11_chr1104 [Sinorhizobium meliloti SM11]
MVIAKAISASIIAASYFQHFCARPKELVLATPWPVGTRSGSLASLTAPAGLTGIFLHPAQLLAFVVHPATKKLIAKSNAVQALNPFINPLPFLDCADGIFQLIGADISAALPIADAK